MGTLRKNARKGDGRGNKMKRQTVAYAKTEDGQIVAEINKCFNESEENWFERFEVMMAMQDDDGEWVFGQAGFFDTLEAALEKLKDRYVDKFGFSEVEIIEKD